MGLGEGIAACGIFQKTREGEEILVERQGGISQAFLKSETAVKGKLDGRASSVHCLN